MVKVTLMKTVVKILAPHRLHGELQVVKVTVVRFTTKKEGEGMKQYGYCRVSTCRQNIERQERNIKAAYPDAVIIKEKYTGTESQGRKGLDKILAAAREGDTIIFDSVSRMSRDAGEGFALYENLYHKGIRLVFLKEPHINTDTYKNALENGVRMTGTSVDLILDGVNKYLMELAREQIRLAFGQAEKEVSDLRQRTREGIETARLNGRRVGLPKGTRLETKKSVAAKEFIRNRNRGFGGDLTNEETCKLAGICRKTLYKYKKEIKEDERQPRG